ncbi:serine/threonine protein kinase [Helicocarpus griseus UAMH5409]|uniref:Serine/threonine protein kinase n=1 Tax=Helicocarpus griseus UAMH5409 TaxID=1447875 RepID=A0A2B7WA40_9EURO|nr:serine/threonine protein kinase [Helicocarpus griseus UAMH5409]
MYGKEYDIDIKDYKFHLIWRHPQPELLRARAIQDYQVALQQQINVRSHDLPTENDSEIHTWHNTRIHTAGCTLFREADGEPRVQIGEGQFGAVYRAVDLECGHVFAVKVMKLDRYPDIEHARAAAHRELKTPQKLKRQHIIDFLGHNKPLAQAPSRAWNDTQLSLAVLEQMLSALDHLACNNICHRDVKPENILYWKSMNGYTFQLADFGLANYHHFASTKCGTIYYEAPELHPEYGQFDQSPKMDVWWSLFATVADIHSMFKFPPAQAKSYGEILHAVRAAAPLVPNLAHMVRENPNHRASAAQLLVAYFDGRT